MITSIAAGLSWMDEVVNYVWVVYIGFMILLVFRLALVNELLKASAVVLLIFLTATYPLYTNHYQLLPGLIANVLHIVLTSAIFVWIRPHLPRESLLLLPVIGWTLLASVSAFSRLLW